MGRTYRSWSEGRSMSAASANCKVAPLHIRLHHVISACHAAAHLAQRNPFWNYTSALNHNRQNLKLSSCRSEQKEIFDSFRFSLNVRRIACNNILARSTVAYIIHGISQLPISSPQCTVLLRPNLGTRCAEVMGLRSKRAQVSLKNLGEWAVKKWRNISHESDKECPQCEAK